MGETRQGLSASASLDQEQRIVLDWSDGHQSVLDPRTVRLACPCASCREERAAASPGDPEHGLGDASFQVKRFEHVGRYALCIHWADGHATGIYSWPMLRALCRCIHCRMERGDL